MANVSLEGPIALSAPALSPAGIVRNKLRALGEHIRSYPETAPLADSGTVTWELLETAPKDGTPVWLRRSDRRYIAAVWRPEGGDPSCWRDLVSARPIAAHGASFTHWTRARAETVLRDEVNRLLRTSTQQADQLLVLQGRLLAETHRADVAAERLLAFADARALLRQVAENGEPTTVVHARPLLRVRDALVRGDVEEAFHHLVILADPRLTKSVDDLWGEWEALNLSIPALHPDCTFSPDTGESCGRRATRVQTGNVAAVGRPLSRLEERILDRAVQPLGFALRWDLRWYERGLTRTARKAVDSLASAALLTPWGAAGWDIWKATPEGLQVQNQRGANVAD